MNVSNVQATPNPVPAVNGAEAKRAQLQLLLLKKALDTQQQQSVELAKQAEGKGQTLDIRV